MNRNLINLCLVGLIVVLLVLGCASSGNNPTSSLPTKTNYFYLHGSKINVIKHKEENKIAFFQSDLIERPVVKISNKQSKGNDSFTFFNNINTKFDGKSLGNAVLSLTHETPYRNGAIFPTKGKLKIVADGKAFYSLRELPIELKKDSPKDKTFYEVITTEIAFDDFKVMSNAKSVTIQIGNASFDLSLETLLALKGFVNTVQETAEK
jgi:hypothetical protein